MRIHADPDPDTDPDPKPWLYVNPIVLVKKIINKKFAHSLTLAVPGAARAGGGLGPDGEVPGALHIQVPEGGAGGSLLSPHRAAAQHPRE